MRLFISIVLIIFYAIPAYSNQTDSLFTINNDTDNIILTLHSYSYSSTPDYSRLISPHDSVNFSLSEYARSCVKAAYDRHGRRLYNKNKQPLFYADCKLEIFPSNATIIIARKNQYDGHYTAEAVPTKPDDCIIYSYENPQHEETRNSGYGLVKSGENQQELHIQNANIYFMVNNKSKPFVAITVNSECEVDKKIGDGLIIPTMPGGNSIWEMPNWLIHQQCGYKADCDINLFEVSKPRGSWKGTCGDQIGTVKWNIRSGVTEIITSDPNKHSISIESYGGVPISVRQSIVIR